MHQLFSKPEDAGGPSGKAPETIELLSEDDVEQQEETLDLKTEKTPEDEDKESDGEETEDDELKEIEEELKEPKEEDLEFTQPIRRREILAKYPNLFKDFPYLEKAYYREQQFTEILPTIKDAKTAVEKAQILDRTEREIMNGDISSVLMAAKQEDNEVFYKIADNYLPTLRKVDQQAYYHVLGNVIKDTIITMVREGRSLGEQGVPLQQAANILNQFVFGSQNFQPPTNLSKQTRPEDTEREEKFKKEDQQRIIQQFESVRDELQVKADNVLKSTIEQNIDPRNSMTDYVKKNASREALEIVQGLIDKDTRFRTLLDRLWEKSYEKGFDKDSTDKIKSAYLSKARTLLPSVLKKVRIEASRGTGRRVENGENKEQEQASEKRGPITPGRSTSPSSGKYKKATDIPKGMSTLDVLMQD